MTGRAAAEARPRPCNVLRVNPTQRLAAATVAAGPAGAGGDDKAVEAEVECGVCTGSTWIGSWTHGYAYCVKPAASGGSRNIGRNIGMQYTMPADVLPFRAKAGQPISPRAPPNPSF